MSTIQAELDLIIREPMAGVLVVEGGPGTGKTAVALHRVAYLLHRHRDRLERSMTLVGDIHQASSPAGATGWEETLDRRAHGNWRRAGLTVNYRTPRPIADAGFRMLRASGMSVDSPLSIRDGDPVVVLSAAEVTGHLEAMVAAALGRTDGTVAVVLPRRLTVSLTPHDRLSVLSAKEAKGLEFDHVIVVEPAAFLEARRGAQDLYVALTRATQWLEILHTRPLPTGLED